MHIRTLPIAETVGHVLIHNIFDENGHKILKKGTILTQQHLLKLRATVHKVVDVGILADAPADVHEDEAAQRIAEALLLDTEVWRLTPAYAGRVNVHTKQDGLLYVDVKRLIELNCLPGVTLATRRQYTTIGPSFETTQAATLKIIPYAIPCSTLEQAISLIKGLLRLVLLPRLRIALLITSQEASAPRIIHQFETPTRTRLDKLGSQLTTIHTVEQDESAIASAAGQLLASHDALIIGGQTSIMDIEDITPRALSHIGAEVVLHGAPVEPGNLLALAYYRTQWILCAPGCAKSPEFNVVDLVLPRLIAGQRLERAEIAEMGLGGLL